jgi:hypothetical protein
MTLPVVVKETCEYRQSKFSHFLNNKNFVIIIIERVIVII